MKPHSRDKVHLTGRERVLKTLNYQPVDRAPVDLGGTATSGAHVSIIAKMRQALGLDKPDVPVKVVEPYQMLGEVAADLREALGIDVVNLPGPKNFFGFENADWKPWRTFDGTNVLVPGKFNTEPQHDGDILQYPQGDKSASASARMPKDGFYFDAIIRQKPIDDANEQVYTYDKLYQLTFVDYNDGNTTGFDYDKLGNRTRVVNGGTTIYLSNCLNQYTSVGGVSYIYDKNGNLTRDDTRLYYYDCENHIVNSGAPSMRLYRYDYLGRRVRKGFGAVWTKYCYDGDQVIAEYNNNNTLQRKYVYGPGIDEPICMIDVAGGNAVYYYHFDGLGSVAALSNIAGDVVERYSYSAFGEPNRVSGVGNSYMFTGRNYDSETGLYYYRARYYKPSIGRFLQVDPVDYKDSMNLYTYVLNNPINHIDPKGTFIEFDPICIWQVAKAVRDTKGKNDKYRHCYVGCKISAYCGIEWCVSAGALKELLDKLGLGTPEWKDFVATIDGCTSGLNPFKSCACGCKDKGYSP